MVSPRARSPRSVPGIRLALVAALVLLVLVPTGAMGAPRSSPTDAVTSAVTPSASFSATVTWNGVNVNTAGSAASALSVDFSSSANVVFSWTIPPTPGFVDPNDARLQMIYFGFALSTRDVLSSGPPATSEDMSWTPGAIVYVLEGVYEITASLIANGSTVWSENFYVRANAPYSIFALLPIILIALIAWELYSVARSGRQALLGRQVKTPPSPPEEPAPTEPSSTPPSGEGAPPSGPEEPQ